MVSSKGTLRRRRLFQFSAFRSALLAPPLVIWVSLQHSWQMAFVVTGGIGFIWVALWWTFYRSPKDHWLLGDQERSYIAKGQQAEKSLAAGERRPPMVRKILTAPSSGESPCHGSSPNPRETFNFGLHCTWPRCVTWTLNRLRFSLGCHSWRGTLAVIFGGYFAGGDEFFHGSS